MFFAWSLPVAIAATIGAAMWRGKAAGFGFAELDVLDVFVFLSVLGACAWAAELRVWGPERRARAERKVRRTQGGGGFMHRF